MNEQDPDTPLPKPPPLPPANREAAPTNFYTETGADQSRGKEDPIETEGPHFLEENAVALKPDFALFDIVKAVLLVLAFSLLMGLLLGFGIGFWRAISHARSTREILARGIRYINCLFSLSLVYAAWMFRCRKYGRTFKEGLAIRRVGWKINLGSVALGLAMGTVSLMIAGLNSVAHPGGMDNAPITRMINGPGGHITFLLLILIAPPCEEVFFRGFIYPVLRSKWGVVSAVVLTAFAFAYIHGYQVKGDPVSLSVIFAIAIVFALQRQKYESIVPSTLTHWTYNLTVAFLGMLVTFLVMPTHAKPKPAVLHHEIPTIRQVESDLIGHRIGRSNELNWYFDSPKEFQSFKPTGQKATTGTLDLSYSIRLKGVIGAPAKADIVVHYKRMTNGYQFAGVDDYNTLTKLQP